MPTGIYSQQIKDAFKQVKDASVSGATKLVDVNGVTKTISYPYPSPVDWRDNWIYFILVDRFNNPLNPPASTVAVPVAKAWNETYNFRQGGSINGVREQLDYIASLGAGAIWLSPVLKSAAPDREYDYHGYGAQDFLNIDGRFGSDGTSATAEKELIALVEEAHARGIYVIMDIVLNHTAWVFDYEHNGIQTDFQDAALLNGPLGNEPSILWLDGTGNCRPDWENTLPPAALLSPDDAVWPEDLQRADFFRRRGSKISDKVSPDGFVKGDFGVMRQLVAEYDATAADQAELRKSYGKTPVVNILVQVYRYLIAKFDIDGYRIDTVKYVKPSMVEAFGNAIREFALTIGKQNFFTFGEIYDNEATVQQFIGRNTTDGFGIDAALDFPLFFKLPQVVKSFAGVEEVKTVFVDRKKQEETLLSSHGEAGKYFVSFLDNHDQTERINHPGTPVEQVLAGLAAMFCLQGIPCVYYGTEQGLQGTVDQPAAGGGPEIVREALWGKSPVAFDGNHKLYKHIQQLSNLRYNEPSLLYGRLYFREVSGNRTDYGFSSGRGGILAFSRILADREILVVINTHGTQQFKGFVVMDVDTNRAGTKMKVAYSNLDTVGEGNVQIILNANFFKNPGVEHSETAAFYVELAPTEVQVLIPA